MNVLLVYPKYSDTFWSFKHVVKFVSRKAAFPPLGLLTIAAMLPALWGKKLIDLNVRRLKTKDIKWADYVFISAMIAQKDSAKEVIARCIKLGVKVVVGGPLLESGIDGYEGVSHFFLGEAEDTLPVFLKDLEEGKAKRVYDFCGAFPNIANTPIPMWSLISHKDYASGFIQYSKGCPFRCSFCNIASLNGRIPRNKPTRNLIAEIDAIYNAGFRGPVLFADDNLVGNRTKSVEMFVEVAKWQEAHNYPFNFTFEAPITIADDPELMELAVKAGFYKVFLGVETPIKASLVECGKMQNASRNIEECVRKIHNYGLQTMSGFIVGFDNDPPETFADLQINFIQRSGICVAMVGVLQAPPGTELLAKLESQGRLSSNSSGNNTDCYPNFVPVMPVQTLVSGYKRIMRTIYSPKKYYERICVFLKECNVSKRPKVKIRAIDCMAFFRSIWHIGLKAGWKTSWYYWKTLFMVLLRHRQAFPDVVILWIYGEHFRKIAKLINKS